MQVVITAVGPDHRGLADPIVHHVTGVGANIYEIQMYDHDSERLFAMLLRFEWPAPPSELADLRRQMDEIGREKNLSIRTWSRDEKADPPRLAICTYEDAYQHRMLTYGATVHFIVPELDAGNQIIHQSTFTVFPGTPLELIKRQGEQDNEPSCLVEGTRRVIEREVELHFHKVVRRGRID